MAEKKKSDLSSGKKKPEDRPEPNTENPKKGRTGRQRRRIALTSLLLVCVLAFLMILVNRQFGLSTRLTDMAERTAEGAPSDAGLSSGEVTSSAASISSASSAESSSIVYITLPPRNMRDSESSSADTSSISAENSVSARTSSAGASETTDSSASAASTASRETQTSAAASGKNGAAGSSSAGSPGNTSSKSAEKTDHTAPVIKGADNVWISVGTSFNVMDGVTVTDDTDPSPSLAASPSEIDTSKTGAVSVKYTAKDRYGNTSSVTRHVHIANSIGTLSDGTSFPIYWDTSGINNQPYLVAVNRGQNCVTVYQMDDDGQYTVPVKAMVCSVGSDTPDGYYRTEERYRWKDLFENSYGQYAVRITGHILFHSVPYDRTDPSTLQTKEYNLLGSSASHGCVRLTAADAKWIYDNCPDNFPCILYVDNDNPGPLGKPSVTLIDLSDSRAGWDPSDPDEANPWLTDSTQASS